MKGFEYLAARPWAIRPEMIELGVSIALREHTPQALPNRDGAEPSDSDAAMEVRDGVAIIPIAGPIFRYASFFTSLCGGTTTEAIAKDLRRAIEDPSIRAIILDINSPGGEATSIGELAGQIRDASAVKPVVAYADGDCCSAAYWLASAAGEIVASRTAVLGSIGVVWVHPTKKDDGKSVEFVSSVSPNKRPDVSTDKGKAEVQRVVDAMAEVFVADVADNRDTTPEAVVSDFGAGGLKVGQAAVDAGMADRVGTFEDLLAELADGTRPTPKGQTRPVSKPGPPAGAVEESDPMPKSWAEQFKALMASKPAGEAIPETSTTSVAVEGEAGSSRADASAAGDNPALEDHPLFKAWSDRMTQQMNALAAAGHKASRDALIGKHLGNKVYPANRAQADALLAQLQADDLAKPLASGSRVALFEAFLDKAPSGRLSRSFVEEAEIPDDATTVASGPEGEDDEDLGKFLGMTTMGAAIRAQTAAK